MSTESRTIRAAERYGANEQLCRYIANELHFLDFQTAIDFYANAGPYLSDTDLALLGCNDRFFLLVHTLHRADACHPWLYDRCREVEAAPDGHLDLWAREHYKSTIITYAGAIQEVVTDPEVTIGLFSHTRDISEKFLEQIMREFESNEDLKRIYPDVLWDNPKKQAPRWAVNGGIIVKRTSNPKEGTIEAWGLVDGQPTSKHFSLLIYDDVVTLKSVTNPQQVKKTTEAWELSDNLGAGNVRKWHIGTRYCTPEGTRITMADFSHKPIQDVAIGDDVLGWELRDGKRYLRPSRVTDIGGHREQPVNRYWFSDGFSVVCTPDHRWWRGPHGSGAEYKPIGMGYHQMKTARRLLYPMLPEATRDAAWLAGFFDGEGTIKKNPHHPSGSIVLTQSMAHPELVEQTRKALGRLGFEWSESWHSPSKTAGQEIWKDRCNFLVNGGWRERYRFLAQVAPVRRKALAQSLMAQLQTEPVVVEKVEHLAPRNVFWLTTETGNYVAEGLCSSNSFADTYGVILERKVLKPRIYPATDNGRIDGTPVFMPRKRWEEKKKTQRATLAAQMLQNPLAGNENTFKPEWLRPWEVRPQTLTIYIMGDPARGKSAKSDRTAFAVVGVDANGNKYLLDGVRHRMSLSERWETLRDLYLKWERVRGVQLVSVGYERYGMQSDDEYFQEQMDRENVAFEITELSWTQEGQQSKTARVERLEPDFRLGRFFLPSQIHVPGDGACTWGLNPENSHLDLKQVRGLTRDQQIMKQTGQDHRISKPIVRKDEDGKLYDLTRALIEEMMFFPFAPKDDLVDAVSRIYDMQATPPLIHEDAYANRQEFAIDA